MKMDASVMVKGYGDNNVSQLVSDILMHHDGYCIYFHKLKVNANALPYVKHPTIMHCHKYQKILANLSFGQKLRESHITITVGKPSKEIFGILDILRSILVHFGTLVYHGKVHVVN